MIDPSLAIANLSARWHSLKDPDRALAVLPIIRAGVSGRKVAPMLNCSPSLIRRLLQCLEADPGDLEFARQCQISTNELLRRAKQAQVRREASCQQALEVKRAERAANGANAILGWLASDGAASGNAEQVLQEAKFVLMRAEETGGLPQSPAPVGMKLEEIIFRSRPAELTADQVDVAWFARWLALWSFYAFPDNQVLWGALEQALSSVQSRSWMAKL